MTSRATKYPFHLIKQSASTLPINNPSKKMCMRKTTDIKQTEPNLRALPFLNVKATTASFST